MELDLSKYLGLFVSESKDHLEALSRTLVDLERAQAGEVPELVDKMFRHAHSMKGMASTMQFDGIALLAHRAEDVIGVLRGRSGPIDAEVVDLLLSAADSLLGMVEASAGGGAPGAPSQPLVDSLAQAFAALKRGERVPAPEAPTAVDAPPPPAPAAPPASAGALRLAVEVEVAGACPVPSVRGYLVLKRLEALGTVLAASPGHDDLKAGRIPDRRLTATIETTQTPQAVEQALAQIADLAKVVARPAGEEPSPPVAAAKAEAPAEAQRTVRVRAELLDEFLDVVGELLLATARLRAVGRAIPEAQRRPHDDGVDRLHSVVKDLHLKVMAARMTPLTVLSDRLPRAARDLARRGGKQVDVSVSGAEIEIDRSLLEDIADPVLHVLRNAVDHGLETPAERIALGKSATGHVEVSARRERDRVVMEIADDGRGMDPERLRQAAVERGALSREQAAALSDAEALELACLPGVSTARAVTDVSGRGVGMDAVKRAVEAAGGSLQIESRRGQGTRIAMRLPLTVAVQPVLLVRVADEILALPVSKVHGAAEVELEKLERSGGAPLLGFGGTHLPVHDLATLIGLSPGRATGKRSVVVTEGGEGRVGLAVDQLLGQEEAVLKPLHRPLSLVPGLSAVTVLGSGRPVFVLDVPRLVAA
ncbi:MAG TPA: chemotaxis protein CheA [Anaeromyxobacteraceae bacterium]|nr:chemotaxis protein CheA [Anaeromyxobacteraceae bacterium]